MTQEPQEAQDWRIVAEQDRAPTADEAAEWAARGIEIDHAHDWTDSTGQSGTTLTLRPYEPPEG